MRKLVVSKSIEEAEMEAKSEGTSLRQWMLNNGYEFNNGNTIIDKYIEVQDLEEVPMEVKNPADMKHNELVEMFENSIVESYKIEHFPTNKSLRKAKDWEQALRAELFKRLYHK